MILLGIKFLQKTVYSIIFTVTVFLSSLTLCASILSAAPFVASQPNSTPFEIHYLLDKSCELSLADILNPQNSARFKPHDSTSFKFGMAQAVIWFRLKIEPPTNETDYNSLILGVTKRFSYVDLYLPQGNLAPLSYKVIKAGSVENQTDKKPNYRYATIRLPEHIPGNRYIYLRINPFTSRDHNALNFSLFIEPLETFYEKTWLELSFFGLITGIMATMVLYNLFIFFVLKDKVYLLYIFYILSILAYLFLRAGLINLFGFGGLKPATIPAVTIGLIFGCLFTQSFLDTRRYCPVLHKFIWLIIGSSTIVIIGVLVGHPREANILIHLLGILSPTILIASGFQRLFQGYIPARTYVAAWGFLLLGTVIAGSMGLGLLPTNFFTSNVLFMGSAIEAIILSLALAQRIKVLKKEKESLQKKEKHLAKLSITDSLTGLYNKRWFSNTLPNEIMISREHSTPLSLMVLDVDHFKKFNDTYGHAHGDKVLAKLGQVMSSSIRERDIACRYGGEEFCIILPMITVDLAVEIAERIRQKFELSDIKTDSGKSTRATISIGLTSLKVHEHEKDLFDRADKAVYQAKSKGRNQVVSI